MQDRSKGLTNRVLIFDEIGLAELAPDNPLKVLHSYLDPGSEDVAVDLREAILVKLKKISSLSLHFDQKSNEPTKQLEEIINNLVQGISFIGISNWRLDASKSNRMIFVARPKMESGDLV